MQVIRDKILASLAPNFSGEQLAMIDDAVSQALIGYTVTQEETLPAPVDQEIEPVVYEYLARKKSKGLSEGTIDQYARTLRMFCMWSRKKLEEVRDYDIIRYLDEYETYRHIGRARKNDMRVELNTFFRYLSDTGRIEINPMATIDAIKFPRKVRESLSDLELEKLRRACRTPRERAVIDFLFATGCRVSEMVALNRDDIDYDRRQVKVYGKGSKERIVFLNASAIISLNAYFSSRSDKNHALFISDRQPYGRVKKNTIENIVKNLGQRAGLTKRVFPHLLRHTCATFLLRHGMAIEMVQEYLGHEDLSTTRIYAKTDRQQLRATYDRTMAA